MAYSKKVLDRFEAVTNNPAAHGVGRFDPDDPHVATGMTGAPACGDVMKLDLKLNPETEEIIDVKFKTYGCGSAIASSSMFIEMLVGKTREQAKLIKDMKLNSYIQVTWQFKNNIVEFQKRIIQMDQEISAEAPKSISELEMRLGFYAVSLSLDILDKGDFPKGEKEKKSIEAIAQVLKAVGKY